MRRRIYVGICAGLMLAAGATLVAAQDDNNAGPTPVSDLLQRFASRFNNEASRASTNIGRVASEASTRISALRSDGNTGEANESLKRARAVVVFQSELAIQRTATHYRLGMASLIGAGASPAQVASLAQQSFATVQSIRQARRSALNQLEQASKSPAGLTTVNG